MTGSVTVRDTDGIRTVELAAGDLNLLDVEWLSRAQRGAAAYALGRRSRYEFAELDYFDALDAALARFAPMFKESS